MYGLEVPTSLGTVAVLTSSDAVIWTSVPGGTLREGKKWLKEQTGSDTLKKQETVLNRIVRKQLERYMERKLAGFTVPVSFIVGSAFQKTVWRELLKIPYGQTVTYGQLATRIGKPGAARAVGGACRRNPVAIFVPCHRVVGADNALVGYAGSKTSLKAHLLRLEQNLP